MPLTVAGQTGVAGAVLIAQGDGLGSISTESYFNGTPSDSYFVLFEDGPTFSPLIAIKGASALFEKLDSKLKYQVNIHPRRDDRPGSMLTQIAPSTGTPAPIVFNGKGPKPSLSDGVFGQTIPSLPDGSYHLKVFSKAHPGDSEEVWETDVTITSGAITGDIKTPLALGQSPFVVITANDGTQTDPEQADGFMGPLQIVAAS